MPGVQTYLVSVKDGAAFCPQMMTHYRAEAEREAARLDGIVTKHTLTEAAAFWRAGKLEAKK